MVLKDEQFAMNCLDYFGVTAMAGVEDLKFLRNRAGNPEPKAGMDLEPKNVRLCSSPIFSGSFTHARFK